MAQARRVEPGAVVVDGRRAVDDLVLPVGVDVGDDELVVALPGVALVPGFVGVEEPAGAELLAVEVDRPEGRTRVVAAREDGAGVLAVEIGGRGEEAVHAVSVAVAPVLDVPARHRVVDGVERRAALAVEHGEELRSLEDVALFVAVVGLAVADHGAGGVDGAVGRLHDQLGPAVGVEVVQLGLRVVRPGADVGAHVDPPQLRAVELVGIEVDVPGCPGLGVVLGVRRIPLQHELELAVAIEIRGHHVVRAVLVLDAVGCGAAGGLVQRDVEVLLVPGGEGLARPERLAAADRAGVRRADELADRRQTVLALGRPLRVDEVGRLGDRLLGDLLAVAEDQEAGVHRFVPEQAPREEHAVVGDHAEGAAVETFGIALQRCRGMLLGRGGGGRLDHGDAGSAQRERQGEQERRGPAHGLGPGRARVAAGGCRGGTGVEVHRCSDHR